jgi:hypothetical protein
VAEALEGRDAVLGRLGGVHENAHGRIAVTSSLVGFLEGLVQVVAGALLSLQQRCARRRRSFSARW